MTYRLRSAFVASVLALAATSRCVPRDASSPGASAPASPGATAAAPTAVATAEAPPPPPRAPVPAVAHTGDKQTDRFLELWTEMHDLSNGYFSPEGIPYHAVETLIVEAPDQGHETTSEAYSYFIWLEAMYGKVTGDFTFFDRAWKNMDYYAIPRHEDQPSNDGYGPGKPATYSEEGNVPTDYPKPLVGTVKVGKDPIAEELKRAYGTSDVYGMHWLIDVDNFYGFGRRSDGKSRVALINTFQRGPEESVFEAVPQPCWDSFQFGGKHGYLDLFQSGNEPARQWKYSNAPDADARAVQAAYWAKRWSDEHGGNVAVDAIAKSAGRLGDYTRYAFFDKYFKQLGCTSTACEPSTGYESAHYLISWYYAWGGAAPGSGSWAWRIGSSHSHSGYQNPMAAYALSQVAELKPQSQNGARDWGTSLDRQLEFYRWLQSDEGAIAGGATNSWAGRYEQPPAGTKTFYKMAYQAAPVFNDPPSNEWFGFQVWSMQRVAEYYYVSGDARAKTLLDRWVAWAKKNTRLVGDGYEIPSSLAWSGSPSSDWDASQRSAGGTEKGFNKDLHVRIASRGNDVGTAASLARVLSFYGKRAGDEEARKLARALLDRIWKFRDEIGVSSPETRNDYKRFNDAVYVPPGYSGKMPNGDAIAPGATFLSLRTNLKKDALFPKVEAFLKGGQAPTFHYHRFWAQAEIAMAYATYGWLFPEAGDPKG
jgi:hypothetical protein